MFPRQRYYPSLTPLTPLTHLTQHMTILMKTAYHNQLINCYNQTKHQHLVLSYFLSFSCTPYITFSMDLLQLQSWKIKNIVLWIAAAEKLSVFQRLPSQD